MTFSRLVGAGAGPLCQGRIGSGVEVGGGGLAIEPFLGPRAWPHR